MSAITPPAAPAPLTHDEQRWLAAYRNMAPEHRRDVMNGVEGVVRAFPRVATPRLRLVTGNRAAEARAEPR
jgi:hypothetical protein